jgi:hypothetical protein
VFVAPIIFLFVKMSGATELLGDGDTGWHIRTGQWILEHGRVPKRDMFSYTKAGEPWFAWEWLWDVIFGWMHQHWGMAAVLLVSLAIICSTFALLYRLTLRKTQNVVVAAAVVLAAASGSALHWLARPHVFTWLFLIIFYSLMERAHAGRKRALYWLSPLMLLWTNLHGGFIAGLILIGAYAAGELVSWMVETEPSVRAAALARGRLYAWVLLACIAATFANPYGYKLHAHVFAFLSDRYAYEYIQEYLSFNFQNPVGKYVEPMILLGAVAAVWNVYRRKFTYLILLGVWAHLGLMSVRNIPLYMIVAAPPVAACISDLIGELARANVSSAVRKLARGFGQFAAEIGQIERLGRIPIISFLALACVGLLLRAEPNDRFRAEYDVRTYPEKAIEVLRDPSFATGVFTIDVWGGYLIYRLYPNLKVFIDGRADLYGPRFGKKYLDVISGKWNWEKTLDKYHVHTVLLPVDNSLTSTLKESKRWRTTYDDGVAIVFRKYAAAARMASTGEFKAPAVQDGGNPAVTRSQTPKLVVPQDHNPTRGDN